MNAGRTLVVVCLPALALVGLVLGHPVYCGFTLFAATVVAFTASKDDK
jgi:hypothetical protein